MQDDDDGEDPGAALLLWSRFRVQFQENFLEKPPKVSLSSFQECKGVLKGGLPFMTSEKKEGGGPEIPQICGQIV